MDAEEGESDSLGKGLDERVIHAHFGFLRPACIGGDSSSGWEVWEDSP